MVLKNKKSSYIAAIVFNILCAMQMTPISTSTFLIPLR